MRRFNKGKDRPFGAVLGVLQTVLQMLEGGTTHLGVASDHVIESFAIACGPATRRAKASSRRFSSNFIRWRTRSPRWA
jgi:hypothetical protein